MRCPILTIDLAWKTLHDFIKLGRIFYLESQRFLPVGVWHFQEDSQQKLSCFFVRRHDHHIGPRAQSEALCEVVLTSSHCALVSLSELGEKRGWQSLPEVLELEGHGDGEKGHQERPATFQTPLLYQNRPRKGRRCLPEL